MLVEKYILNALQGDNEAFMELYNQFGERALRLSMSITRDRQLAEDAVQVAFLRVYRKGHQFKTTEKFEPWFFRIVINESKRLIKKKPQEMELPIDFGSATSFTGEINLREMVSQVMSSLSEEQRTILSLKFVSEYTEKEIAQILRIPLGTVKSRLHYAKKSMANILKEGEGND